MLEEKLRGNDEAQKKIEKLERENIRFQKQMEQILETLIAQKASSISKTTSMSEGCLTTIPVPLNSTKNASECHIRTAKLSVHE